MCCHTLCKEARCTKGLFGGINVVLFGDLHQFPPVFRKGALYYPDDPETGPSLGRQMFEMFTTVVTLRQQMRVQDRKWTDMLYRLRVGGCTAQDISMVKGLILGGSNVPSTDFASPPWLDAVLVTSRNSVRDFWNEAALRRHTLVTGNVTYVCPSDDFVGKAARPLTRVETKAVAGLSQKRTGKLAFSVETSVGMQAMVLLNIATESDLANGSRGTVTQIVLDSREDALEVGEDGRVYLAYPPVCVIFRLDHSTFPPFEGLKDGEVPVFPSQTSFTITLDSGEKRTIHRRQLAMTPVYAFTDYKSQGQTIEQVIVDLGESTRNSLDPFHAYVSLSRSRGRETIRLLRDFDTRLLTTHPCVHLIDEDKRLATLDAATMLRHGRGDYATGPTSG